MELFHVLKTVEIDCKVISAVVVQSVSNEVIANEDKTVLIEHPDTGNKEDKHDTRILAREDEAAKPRTEDKAGEEAKARTESKPREDANAGAEAKPQEDANARAEVKVQAEAKDPEKANAQLQQTCLYALEPPLAFALSRHARVP